MNGQAILLFAPSLAPGLRNVHVGGGFCLGVPFMSAERPVRPCSEKYTCVADAPRTRVSPAERLARTRRPAGPRRVPDLHVETDRIDATPVQTMMVAGFGLLTALTAAKITYLLAGDPYAGAMACFAAFAGYLFADFGTGVYHFFVDNYGNEDTPIVGYQIAAFQGHHKSPWTITSRDFANNLYRLTIPTSPQMLALLVLPISPVLIAGISSALFWITASQELHKQAHMQRPARYAQILQALGLIVSRKEHGLHHASPFDDHYCIVSGICNHMLDKTLFFRRLEAFIYRMNGVEPISWKLDPDLKKRSLSLLGIESN